MKLLLSVLVLATLSFGAGADCIYNDQAYPEGTILGPMVCSDGRWQQR